MRTGAVQPFNGVKTQEKAHMVCLTVCTLCSEFSTLAEIPMPNAWQRNRKLWNLLGLFQSGLSEMTSMEKSVTAFSFFFSSTYKPSDF